MANGKLHSEFSYVFVKDATCLILTQVQPWLADYGVKVAAMSHGTRCRSDTYLHILWHVASRR